MAIERMSRPVTVLDLGDVVYVGVKLNPQSEWGVTEYFFVGCVAVCHGERMVGGVVFC